MKKINKYLAFVLGAGVMISSQSCSEDYLDVDQYEILTPEYLISSDEGLEDGILSCYANMNQLINGDSMKPWLWLAGHPTMDTQATGWDKSWLTQSWSADQGEMYDEWNRLYNGITLCNDLLKLVGSKPQTVSGDILIQAEAEARAMRGFYYLLASMTWANIPILSPGQKYDENLPGNGGEAGNAIQVLDTIIADLTFAKDNLQPKPRNDQYGRATSGMARAFLAEAYLWKEYRNGNPSGPGAGVNTAKQLLKEIIDSGAYQLQESFTTLFDPLAWNKESIWEEVMDEGGQSNQWGDFHTNAHGWTDNYAASPQGCGGWGTLYLSWEWYFSYENGDKRRDGSACTGAIKDFGNYKSRLTDQPLESEKSQYCFGTNPYMMDIPSNPTFHANTGGDRAPAVFSLKWWRTGKNTWWSAIWNPVHIYWKRYADVLLTYAECCFRTGDEAEGWKYINMIRERAFGKYEAGNENALTEKYNAYYRKWATEAYSSTWAGTYTLDHYDTYPVPFGSNMDKYVDGKEYYTKLKDKLGFNLEVWQVAMLQERRKEFNCEWTLAPALHREGLLAEHIRVNYPKDDTPISALDNYPWTPRSYEYSEDKMNFPIPSKELVRNPNLKQNKGY